MQSTQTSTQPPQPPAQPPQPPAQAEKLQSTQREYYQAKLAYEMDSWDLFEALQGDNPQIVVVDGRTRQAYQQEHIPGAINVPHREIHAQTAKDLDTSKTYVCYCDGMGCNASTKTALKLLELGFSVKELIGGLDWWKRDGYTTESQKKPNAQASGAVACGC